jgi:hypothetical protein
MADKGGAYANKASDTDFRKKWDKAEYAERAKQKDTEEKERMQENEERMKQGQWTSVYHAFQLFNTATQESDPGKDPGKIFRSLPN